MLLILSCGKKKDNKLKNHKMQALKAYIGPMFQVIKKAERERRLGSNIFIGIISAKYGFLRNSDYIEYYDMKINRKLAKEYNPKILSQIRKWHNEENFNLIYILMGKDYLETVEGISKYIDTQIIIENMGGLGVGQKKLVKFIEKYSL